MVDKNVQIKIKNGASWDNVFPKTKAAIVMLNDGVTNLSSKLTALDSAITAKVGMTEVNNAINALINSAPAVLDTLNELAQALGNDASFSTTMTNNLATKAPLASPALTGTPTAPTASAGINNTQIATTAFVVTKTSDKAPLNSPELTGTPTAPTAISSTNNTQLATTAFVATAVGGITPAIGVTEPPISNFWYEEI